MLDKQFIPGNSVSGGLQSDGFSFVEITGKSECGFHVA
jgi:hypothetical protein